MRRDANKKFDSKSIMNAQNIFIKHLLCREKHTLWFLFCINAEFKKNAEMFEKKMFEMRFDNVTITESCAKVMKQTVNIVWTDAVYSDPVHI